MLCMFQGCTQIWGKSKSLVGFPHKYLMTSALQKRQSKPLRGEQIEGTERQEKGVLLAPERGPLKDCFLKGCLKA